MNVVGSPHANVDPGRLTSPLETSPNCSFFKSSDVHANESQNQDCICDQIWVCSSLSFTVLLIKLLLEDSEMALKIWLKIFPKAWSKTGIVERENMEISIAMLLGGEHHHHYR